MNVPKTQKEFDYDLWTTESGAYMVRVKATGEVCEVDIETMRFLRAEEKQLRRIKNKRSGSLAQFVKEPFLPLDCLGQETGNSPFSSGQESKGDLEEIVMANILIERFLATLTPKQLGVYQNCIIGGKQYVEYAKELGSSYQYIQDCIAAIRKKARIFFE